MENCIFCKIIRGEIPCHKVYEDDLVLAFLDIHPEHAGHTLVIPKAHINHFDDVPPEASARMVHVAQRIAKAIKQTTGVPRVGLNVLGFDVPHAHLHVLPLTAAPASHVMPPMAAPEDLKTVAEQLSKLV